MRVDNERRVDRQTENKTVQRREHRFLQRRRVVHVHPSRVRRTSFKTDRRLEMQGQSHSSRKSAIPNERRLRPEAETQVEKAEREAEAAEDPREIAGLAAGESVRRTCATRTGRYRPKLVRAERVRREREPDLGVPRGLARRMQEVRRRAQSHHLRPAPGRGRADQHEDARRSGGLRAAVEQPLVRQAENHRGDLGRQDQVQDRRDRRANLRAPGEVGPVSRDRGRIESEAGYVTFNSTKKL